MGQFDALLAGGSGAARIKQELNDPSALFRGATWDQVGANKELTDFLHKSMDPDGSKYGGDTDALKTDILNTKTARGSSALASIWDAGVARGESVNRKQFENLVERLYQDAPNRLVSGNVGDTMNAVGSGLKGALGYDLPLNIFFGAGIWGKGLTRLGLAAGGRASLEKAGQAAVGGAVERAAATEAGSVASREALLGAEEAIANLPNQLMRQGAKEGAILEATGGAAAGALGDVAQQDAQVSRGNRSEISLLETGLNTAAGAGLGGLFGGLGGALEGRQIGKRLAAQTDLPVSIAKAREASATAKAGEAAPEVMGDPVAFNASRDDYLQLSADLAEARNDLTIHSRLVKSGVRKSQYTPEQLDAMQAAMVRLTDPAAIANQYARQAEAFANAGDAISASAAKAKADNFTMFAQHMMNTEVGGGTLTSTGDLDPAFVNLLKSFDDDVAASFSVAPAKKGSTSKAAPGAPAAQAAPVAEAAPAAQPADQVTDQVAAAAKAEIESATPAVADPKNPTAAEITSMAPSRFTPQEQEALANLSATLTQAGLELQPVLDQIASGAGMSKVVADVAKAAGVKRSVVEKPLSAVTAAAQREASKINSPVEAAPAVAAQPKVEAPAVAQEVTEESVAAAEEAVKQAKEVVEAGNEKAWSGVAALNHERMVADLTEQRTTIGTLMDEALSSLEKDATSDQKTAKMREALENAAKSDPSLAPMLAYIDPKKLTSKRGVENAKVRLSELADNAVAFTYAKVIGDVLPDPTNVDSFDVVLKSVLRNASAEDAAKISQAYRHMVHNALVDRIAAVGLDAVSKDPQLGPAWQRIVNGSGGFQPMGGKTKTSIDVGAMINRYADQIAAAVGKDGGSLKQLDSKITEAGGVVRDFMRQLQASGIPMDSKFMQDALELRAQQAVWDAINDTFRKENAEAFDKIEKLRELRGRDSGASLFSRSPGRNPFHGSIVENPVLHRVAQKDAAGFTFYTDVMVSGRSQPRNERGVRTAGRVQGILSDGISDYIGLIWAKPKKAFAAASAAYRAIHGAAVDNASWSRGSMIIDGEKFSGSMKELKGRYAERVVERLEQSRFDLILDAIERSRLSDDNPRFMSQPDLAARLEKIGSMSRPVTDNERITATLFLDHRDRISSNTAVAQAEMKEILAHAADMGESAGEQIRAIVNKLESFKEKNNGNLIAAMESYGLAARDKTEVRGKAGEGAEKGAAKVEHPGALKADSDGTVTNGIRDRDPVILKINGQNYEFVPEAHIKLDRDGAVRLFGDRIGTWGHGTKSGRSVKLNVPGFIGEEINDLTQMSRKALVKQFSDKFTANIEKLVKAGSGADAIAEGSQIDASMAKTQAVHDAQKALMNEAAPTASDMERRISAIDVPDDRVVAFKVKSDSSFRKPGQTQRDMTVGEFLSYFGLTADDVEIGTVPAGRITRAGRAVGVSAQKYMLMHFQPIGSKGLAPVDQALVKKLAEKAENAIPMIEAKRGPISIVKAADIKLSSGQTLAQVVDEFNMTALSLRWDAIADIDSLNSVIAKLREQANTIESVAPHGVKMKNASRRTSFYRLQQAMSGYSKDELVKAMDVLRRIDANERGLPYFYSKEGSGNQFSAGFGEDAGVSKVTIGSAADSTPKHVAVIHEIGHWGFHNILSPSEKIAFLESLSKHYDADGNLNPASVMESMRGAVEIEKLTGRKLADITTNTNELFGWQFTSYALGKINDAAEKSLWERMVKYGRNLLAHFLGQKLDPDMVPLFERIMPSGLAEQKYDYSVLHDARTGELVDVKNIADEKRAKVAITTGIMEKIDTLRSNLGRHILTPGGVDVGLMEDMRAAANHMFGLLYGKDDKWKSTGKKGQYLPSQTVAGLRAALNPFREATGNDRWMRDPKTNKVMKDEAGRALVKTEKRPEWIDPRELFSRNSTGKLMQAIREAMPEGVADNVAFEAAVASEEFNVVVKATAIGDNPEVQALFNQALEQELKRKIASGVKESDALDAAENFAYKEAAAYAKEAYGIDVSSSMFDDAGSVNKLGSSEQVEALGEAARKLYDMMSDAMEHLHSKVVSDGFVLQRVNREVSMPERTDVDARIEQAVAKDKPSSKAVEQKPAPTTEKVAQIVKREESESISGAPKGVPEAAPNQWKALISRIPHRDEEQNAVIGRMAYRLFSELQKDGDEITNADISLMTGIPLEEGVIPGALASSNTEAFDTFRKTLRLASEELSNGNKNPMGAAESVADMIARINFSSMADEFDLPEDFSAGWLSSMMKDMLNGRKMDSNVGEFMGFAYERLADVERVLSGLGSTSNARRAVGETIATEGKPIAAKIDGGKSLHPLFARGAVEARVSALPAAVTARVMDNVGLKSGSSIADNIGFIAGSNRRVFSTVDEMMASAINEPRVAAIDAEIARAMSDGDESAVAVLTAKRDVVVRELGMNTDGVTPVLIDMSRVYDPMTASDAARFALDDAMSSGKFKNERDALKSLNYIGTMEGEVVNVFNTASVHDLEKQIARAADEMVDAVAPDAPLTGEVVLNMSLLPDAKADALAVEQRAVQAGATKGVASAFARLWKKNKPTDGLDAKEFEEVRKFTGIQLRSNSSRIRSVGGNYLADMIDPIDGTGFYDALAVRLSSSLMPIADKLDKLTGVDTWYKKTFREIKRNVVGIHNSTIAQSPVEEGIVMAMRTGDITNLGMEERKVVAALKRHFRDLLEAQRDAGIPVADITDATNEFYLPQRFNTEWIRRNRDEAIKMLGDWFEKDRAGSPTLNSARADAIKVIDEAINREELQGIVDSTSSTFAQAFGDKLHSRRLRIVGKDWERMAPMFDNNLRSLLISYTEAANKRIEWSKRFGVRGHGASTYIDIAERGYAAAVDALMGQAEGIKLVRGGMSRGEELLPAGPAEVEFSSSLFSPMFRDEQTAMGAVAQIAEVVSQDSSDASRRAMISTLIENYKQNGGSGVDHFAKRAEAVVNGLADFGDRGGNVASSETDFMRRVVGTLGGRPAYTIIANHGIREAAQAVKTFNSVTLLSGAVLSSLTDPVLALARSGSMGAWVKGTAKAVRGAMSDPAYASAMMRVGVAIEATLNENVTHVHGGISGRISNAFFNAVGLTPWTSSMRQAAAVVGFESIKANQAIIQRERFAGNTGSYAYRKSMRYLRQLGVAHLADTEKLDTFSSAVSADTKVAEAIHRFVNESVFQPNRNDMPLWTQDPIAGIFWQFKSYPMMMGRMVARSFKEAVAYENGSLLGKLTGKDVGRYEGDPAGLMYLLTVGAAAGSGVAYLKDIALGKNQDAGENRDDWRSARERTISKMAEELGFKDFSLDDPAMDSALGNYVAGLLGIGALGFLGDLMYQSAKSVDNGAYGRERIMSQLAGPSLGLFSDTIQLLEGAHHAMTAEEGDTNSKERNAARKVVKRIPLLGNQDPFAEWAVDGIAGEATDKK